MTRIPEQHFKKCGASCTSAGKSASVSGSKTLSGFLPTLIIAILPKCPMCALAYSTAITMCSGRTFLHEPDWTSYFSIGLAILTLLIVLWNFKGTKTIAAAAIILAGGVIIFNSELISGNTTHYYWGCALVFGGVWLNGSLLHFIRKWTGFGSRKSITVELNGTS